MKKVTFKVLELHDPVKTGGTLKVGENFTGILDYHDRVLFEDENQIEWVFYPRDTCQIIKYFDDGFEPQKFKEYPQADVFAKEESKNREYSLNVVLGKGFLWVDRIDVIRGDEKIISSFSSGKRLSVKSN